MAADDITIKILMQSLDAIDKIEDQLNGFRSDLGNLRVETVWNSTQKDSIKKIEESVKEIHQTLREESEVRRKEVRDLEIKIQESVAKKSDVVALTQRIDAVEKTHAKWYGALGVLGMLLGYFSSSIKTWITSLIQ